MTTIPAERSADRAPERLDEAREIGVIAIDLSRDEPVQQIEGLAEGEGTDRGIDAVGHQASSGEREDRATVLNQLEQSAPDGLARRARPVRAHRPGRHRRARQEPAFPRTPKKDIDMENHMRRWSR